MECQRAPLSPVSGRVGMFWGLNAYCRICWGRVSFTLAASLTIRKAVLDSVENQAEIWNRGPTGANGVRPVVTKPLLDADCFSL